MLLEQLRRPIPSLSLLLSILAADLTRASAIPINTTQSVSIPAGGCQLFDVTVPAITRAKFQVTILEGNGTFLYEEPINSTDVGEPTCRSRGVTGRPWSAGSITNGPTLGRGVIVLTHVFPHCYVPESRRIYLHISNNLTTPSPNFTVAFSNLSFVEPTFDYTGTGVGGVGGGGGGVSVVPFCWNESVAAINAAAGAGAGAATPAGTASVNSSAAAGNGSSSAAAGYRHRKPSMFEYLVYAACFAVTTIIF